MDALELLKEDHHKVKKLFEDAEATEDQKEKRRIFDESTSRSKRYFARWTISSQTTKSSSQSLAS